MPGLVSTMLSAMVQEHERGLGGWHAEWETLPEICTLSSGALEKLVSLIQQLGTSADAMLRNLSVTNGLIAAESVSMALAKFTGKATAHGLVERASHKTMKTNVPLRVILGRDVQISTHLGSAELDDLVDPAKYLGSSGKMIDAVLANYSNSFSLNGRER